MTAPARLLPAPGLVYLLHFDQPYVGQRRNGRGKVQTCRHYVGWTGYDIEQRLEHHASGRGARIMQVVTDAGIAFSLARTWIAGRNFERRVKRWGKSKDLCPICNPGRAYNYLAQEEG